MEVRLHRPSQARPGSGVSAALLLLLLLRTGTGTGPSRIAQPTASPNNVFVAAVSVIIPPPPRTHTAHCARPDR